MKPGDHGTLNTHNHWSILLYHMWGPAWIEIHWNSIWLRARSHMTSHYTWGSVTTLHDFGGVVGRPLDTFFWALTISWSRQLARVWSGPSAVHMSGDQPLCLAEWMKLLILCGTSSLHRRGWRSGPPSQPASHAFVALHHAIFLLHCSTNCSNYYYWRNFHLQKLLEGGKWRRRWGAEASTARHAPSAWLRNQDAVSVNATLPTNSRGPPRPPQDEWRSAPVPCACDPEGAANDPSVGMAYCKNAPAGGLQSMWAQGAAT